MTPRRTSKKNPVDNEFIRPSELEGKPIPDHDGVDCTETNASLTKTGHGFEETMEMVGGIHIPLGSRVVVVCPALCVSHEYDPTKDGKDLNWEALRETAVLEAEGVFLLDADLLRDALTSHRERIAEHRATKAREAAEARGDFELPDPVGVRVGDPEAD